MDKIDQQIMVWEKRGGTLEGLVSHLFYKIKSSEIKKLAKLTAIIKKAEQDHSTLVNKLVQESGLIQGKPSHASALACLHARLALLSDATAKKQKPIVCKWCGVACMDYRKGYLARFKPCKCPKGN